MKRALHRVWISAFLIAGIILSGLVVFKSEASACVDCVREGNIQAYDRKLIPKLDEHHQALLDALRAQSEEATTGATAVTGQQGQIADANNTTRAATVTQQTQAQAAIDYQNIESYSCPLVTSTNGLSKTVEAARQGVQMNQEARLPILAGEPGTMSENGIVDFQNQLYDIMKGLGVERIDILQLLGNVNIPESGPIADILQYHQNLLYARVPPYLNRGLVDNPDTGVKNTLVEADRLRLEAGIGQAVYSLLRGNRIPASVPNTEYLRQIAEENQYGSQYLQEILGGGQMSMRAMLEALALGQFGSGYAAQVFVDNPELIPIAVAYNSMLTNVLLFKQYELLETIALSTSTNVIAVREEEIEDVAARITALNSQ